MLRTASVSVGDVSIEVFDAVVIGVTLVDVEPVDGYLHTRTVWVELSGATRDPFVVG